MCIIDFVLGLCLPILSLTVVIRVCNNVSVLCNHNYGCNRLCRSLEKSHVINTQYYHCYYCDYYLWPYR